MDKDRAEIDHHPAGVGSPFIMMEHDSLALQSFTDVAPDGLDMPFGISGGYHEVVCKRTQTPNIEQGDIPRLLLRSKLRRQTRYFLRFQKGDNLLILLYHLCPGLTTTSLSGVC